MEKIHENLHDTMDTMRSSLVKLSYRGTQLDDIGILSDRLLASSDLFVTRTLPWYQRCWRFFCVCPSWWFSRRTHRRHPSDTLEPQRSPWVIV